jgi:hypothetical protein
LWKNVQGSSGFGGPVPPLPLERETWLNLTNECMDSIEATQLSLSLATTCSTPSPIDQAAPSPSSTGISSEPSVVPTVTSSDAPSAVKNAYLPLPRATRLRLPRVTLHRFLKVGPRLDQERVVFVPISRASYLRTLTSRAVILFAVTIQSR